VRFFVLLASAATLLLAEIPKSVLAEHDLEKRSELALKEAEDQITAASKAYDSASAEQKEFQSHLNTAGELAQLSVKSLQDSGKRASKSPKYFKRAEMKLRSLLRRIDSLEKDVSVDARPPVEKVKILLSEAHEQVLHDIMSKR